MSDYINTIEAAAIIGVTKQRIHQYIRAGELPAKREGWYWFIRRHDAEQFERKKPTGRPRKKI